MSYNILVTSGAGYLGSTMVPDLFASGHKVTVLDNFMFKKASLNHCAYHPDFSVVKGDIRVEKTIASLMQRADVVIPLAALLGDPLCNLNPVGATTVNHDAITLMLRLLSKDQIVLMPTINSAYGTGDENNYCNEEFPLHPISQYAIEKVEIEKQQVFSLRSPQAEATISWVSLFMELQSQTFSLLRKTKDHNSSTSRTGIFLQLLGGRSPVLLTKHSMFGTRPQTSVQSRAYLPSHVLWAQVRPRHHRLYSDIASYRMHLCHF